MAGQHITAGYRAIIAAAAVLLAAPAIAQAEHAGHGPVVGGWAAVPQPNTDPAVRAAARAVLPKIPRKKPRLARIESAQHQIVAGTNYRLVLLLTDRTRWTATVWRKLDGSFEVSGVKRLR